MESSFQQPPGFDQLTKSEQIRYLQDLWDRVSEQSGDLPMPQSHIVLLEQRKASYKEDPTNVRSAYDIIERLTKQSR